MVRRFSLLRCVLSVGIVVLMAFCISCSSSDDGGSSTSRIYLDGEYVNVFYTSRPGIGERTFCGELTFTDGDEHFVFNELFNSYSGELSNGVLTYAAYSDGSIKVIGTEGEISRGIISPDRTFVADVNTDFTDDGDVEIGVSIKKSAGMSNADLIGEYFFVSYYNDPWTAYGIITFYGNGTALYERLSDSDGGVMPDPESINYTVSADGSLTITDADESSHGIVSPDGSMLAVANTDTTDGRIGLDIAIKKSAGMSNALLDDDYICVNYFRDPSSTDVSTSYGLLELYGDGEGYYEQLYTSELFLDSLDVDYDVDPDGTSTFTFTESVAGDAGVYDGIVGAGGDVFAGVDTDDSDEGIGIAFSVRKQ